MENLNNKRCKTCNELSPAELDKCQYCGSILDDKLNNTISELDIKITIGNGDDFENTIEEKQDRVPTDEYFEEKIEKNVSEVDNDQIQFNNIFGFKSENNVPKVEIKNASISNRKKVFLTIICSIIPGFGQLFCLILSLSYMNSDGNEDRKSFGHALFTAALVLFVITCILSFFIALAVYQPPFQMQ